MRAGRHSWGTVRRRDKGYCGATGAQMLCSARSGRTTWKRTEPSIWRIGSSTITSCWPAARSWSTCQRNCAEASDGALHGPPALATLIGALRESGAGCERTKVHGLSATSAFRRESSTIDAGPSRARS